MPDDRNNYLLGYGERLTNNVQIKRSSGPKNPPYSLKDAKEYVKKSLSNATLSFGELPVEACPRDRVTSLITMHPRYISKSDFPSDFLEAAGFQVVGGRSRKIKPRQWGVDKHPDEALTDELLVMSKRSDIIRLSKIISDWDSDFKPAVQLTQIEDFKAFTALDKVRSIFSNNQQDEVLLEVVLHDFLEGEIIDLFEDFILKNGAEPLRDRLRFVKDLGFMPVRTTIGRVNKIAQFSHVRVIRSMPRIRDIHSSVTNTPLTRVKLPSKESIDPDMRAAIIDGGVSKKVSLSRWVQNIDVPEIGQPSKKYVAHGTAVTSAFLFGPLNTKEEALQPICKVDHFRVLDVDTGKDGDIEYYDVLDRIQFVLKDPKNDIYKFVNISLGPDLPIDDGEVTRWSAILDDHLSGGKKFITVAVGNNGENDVESGLNRVQPPSDAVNVVSVGACDSENSEKWNRASYSAMGPGRTPGIVKPEILVFGGSSGKPFIALANANGHFALGYTGTSFAAPYLLRTAVGVKTQLGDEFGLLALRALLIHKAECGSHPKTEVGWGRVDTDLRKLITCEDDEALVVYQGQLPVGEHLRSPIPFPDTELRGTISITATLVISPTVDPSYPNVYTRSGLEVIFRPDSTKFNIDEYGNPALNAKTKSFFSDGNIGLNEYDLREDGYKWEPCLKVKRSFRSSTLNKPCFDIYYHNREEGKKMKKPEPIPYAFIVSIKAPKVTNFYQQVVKTYSHILVPLRPKVEIKVPGHRI